MCLWLTLEYLPYSIIHSEVRQGPKVRIKFFIPEYYLSDTIKWNFFIPIFDPKNFVSAQNSGVTRAIKVSSKPFPAGLETSRMC